MLRNNFPPHLIPTDLSLNSLKDFVLNRICLNQRLIW